jgi:hypothetical protein
MRLPGRVLIALVLTLVLGVVSRRYPIGWYRYDKSQGDALYAVAVYLGVTVLLPRRLDSPKPGPGLAGRSLSS